MIKNQRKQWKIVLKIFISDLGDCRGLVPYDPNTFTVIEYIFVDVGNLNLIQY
jgi:hypothetical protein